MLNELVGQFLSSSDGTDLLKNLEAQGVSAPQATQAVTATAEGAMEHASAGGLDLASLAGGLVGGGGGLGALGGMLGGLGGGAAAPLAGLVAPISQFVAQKTGLAPAMAQTIVAAALPKLVAMLTGKSADGAAPAPTAGVGSMISSLLG